VALLEGASHGVFFADREVEVAPGRLQDLGYEPNRSKTRPPAPLNWRLLRIRCSMMERRGTSRSPLRHQSKKRF
jgi:hypothetical protein